MALDPPADSGSLARLYAGLDEISAAFNALGRAIDQRSNVAIALAVDPLFDRMRADERFAILLDRVGRS